MLSLIAGGASILQISSSGTISGSATTTGSFGRGFIADTLRVNSTDTSATPLFIKSIGTDTAVFNIDASDGIDLFRVDEDSSGNSKVIMRDTSGNADIQLHTGTHTYFNNNGNFGIGTTSPNAKLEVIGDISGSATSTGSFGRVESDTFNTTTFSSTEVTSTNLTVTGTITGSSLDVSGNGNFGGNVIVEGDITAQNYIVSSSVTNITTQELSGSTVFGDTSDDTHQFTGSLFVSNSLAINSTGRGPIDVLGSNGSMGFYLSSTGLKAYLPTDIAHSGGSSTFDLQVANLRLGTGAQGPVTIYPRFNSMLQLGTQDDTNLLTLSGSTQISGSSTSTGSFGALSVGPLNANIVTGNVGINTTTPGEKLEIDGNIKLQQNDQIIWNTNDAVLKSNFSQPAFVFHGSGGELFSLERDSSTIVFKNRSGNGYATVIDADGDTIIRRGGTEKLVVSSTVISGSSSSTGSFGSLFLHGGNTLKVDPQTNRILAEGTTSGRGFMVRDIDHNASGSIYQNSSTFRIEAHTGTSVEFRIGGTTYAYVDNDGQMHVSATANAAKPGYTFSTDTNTGMYHAGTDALGLTAGGTEQLRIASNTISGSSTSTGSFGALISKGSTYIGDSTPIFSHGNNMLVVDSSDSQILSIRRNDGNNQWNFGLSVTGDLNFRERTNDAGSGTTHHIFYKSGYVKFGGNITGSGNLEIAGNISGSSTSTGSFGAGFIDNKLGIGTTSPVEALHVAGKAYVRRTGTATAHGDTDLFVADSTAGSSTAQIQILGGASGQSLLYFSDTDSYSVGGIRYYHSDNRMNFRANDTDILDITSTKISGSSTSTGSFGNIRVGDKTASENRFMSFAGDEGFKIGYAQSGFLAHDGQGTEGVDAEISMTGTGGSAPFNNHGSIVYKTRAVDAIARSSHIFYTGRTSAERVRIDHNGNLGIGQSAPTQLLHIEGSSFPTALITGGASTGATLYLKGANNSSVTFDDNSGAKWYLRYQPGQNRIDFLNAGLTAASAFTILDSDNKIGLGINTPTEAVHISGSGATTLFVEGDISGSSTSTGSFGAVAIGTPNKNTFYGLTIQDDQTAGIALNDTGQGGPYQIAANGSVFYIRYNGENTRSIFLGSTGNVGIGGASTGAKLEVAGNISGSATSTGSFGFIEASNILFELDDNGDIMPI